MEKSLKIYTFVDGVKDTPFPDLANQVEAFDFTYSTSRMNVIPQLSASVMFKRCLDSEWNGEQYILFNGERYFIKQTPSSSKDNTDARWKHDITFVSERNILSGIYFYDVVTSDTETDKYVSNSSNVLFFGDIHEFALRLNYSLQYSGVDYSVVIDDGISSEAMQVAFEDKFISEAIQEIYNIFDLPYYFVGKVCHIGYTSNAITTVLKYGDKDALLSIQKTNANYKIVNSCTGIGSTDNIPFYYPNPSNDRAAIEAAGGKWITPSANLMPPIYRTSLGAERFYPAKNNTYTDPETGLKYIFENTYTTKNPHQHKVLFESIKPSIKGMMNGQPTPKPMDKFLQFAYDTNDNDELDEENNFKHPYFFAKLPIYNGTFGFNLFDQAIVGQDMSMSMTSGNCGACNFVIGVDADSQKNVVQLNEDGTLKRDEDGNVITSGSPQLIQNDTTKYEVWIALKKDDSTFGILMPNAGGNYKPSVSDTFVILGIDMPQTYISAAEDRLYKEIIKYMFLNNAEKFTFAINFSRIYLAENPLVYNQLNENARIRIEYNGKEENLYISDYTYKVSKSEALPDITVTLSDTLTIRKGTLQTSIDSVKQEIMSSVGSSDFYKQGLKYFVRKDVPDYAVKITAKEGFDVGSYSPNTGGGTFRRNADGTTFMEVDKLLVRIKAYFEQLEVVSTRYSGGNNIYSAAAMTCIKVEDKGANYRCYFLSEQDGTEVKNRFVVGDQVRCQEFDLIKKNGTAVTNRSYWRLVTGIGSDYIDISKTDAMAGSDIPLAGDDIIQFGNRTEKDRQNLIIQYTVGVNAPLYSMLQGVNSYSLEGKDILQQGFNASTGKAFQRIYGESYIGARDLSQFMKYTPEGGLEIKGRITSVGGDGITGSLDKIEEEITTIKTESDLFAESVTKNFEDIQDQIDGAIETWFEDPAPTLTNKPAIDWNTVALKNQHLGDLYYSGEGKAYRFQMNGSAYEWKMLSDSDITLALANAKKAQDTADGKRRVYIRQPLNAEVYDVGDLWVNANFGTTYSNDLLRCKVAKAAGVAFNISHWEKASKYTDDTKALEAAKAASDAQASANEAISDANEANALLADIASDSKLTATEKQATKKEWDIIVSEKPLNNATAVKFGIATTTYDAVYSTLNTYITPLLASLTTTSAITGTDFRAKFKAYYDARTNLLNAISDKAKQLADNAQSDIDNLQIGGRNLLLDSKVSKSGASYGVGVFTSTRDFVEGEELTVTIRGYIVGTKLFGIWFNENDLGGYELYKVGDNFYSRTFKVPTGVNNRKIGIFLKENQALTDTWEFEWIKLETGNRRTDWTPAPEEVAQDITDVGAAAEAADAKAKAAGDRLNNWASDATVSPSEKLALKQEAKALAAEKDAIVSDAAKYSVSSAAYVTAYTAYNNELTYHSTTTPENITIRAAFATSQTAYYTAQKAILNAIVVAAKKIADDAMTTANKGVADAKAAQTAANTANAAVTAIKDFTDVAFADGVIDRGEAAAIEKYKNTVNESQKSIQGGYTTLYANGYLAGTAKTGLKTAYDAVGVSITALLAAINTAIADKKTTAAEKLTVDTAYATFSTKINLYYAAVEIANKSIQDVLKKYSDDALAAVADLSYLTAALNGNTSIQGGLVLTSLISLGTGTGASFIPKSGLNGIYNSAKVGGGIAFWVGGAMKDRADYTTATMPTDVAKGIDRFDGSGYRANGNMSWNAAGELTVSTQFFKVISSTGISKLEYSNVRDTLDFNANVLFKTGITLKLEGDATDYIPYLKWLKSVFENDTTNNAVRVKKGIYSDSFVSAKGASTGGGGGGGIIQSVYPYSAIGAVYLDTNLTDTFNAYTISKLASRIKIIEDSGVGGSTAWADITGKPSWIGATKPTYSYSEITGAPPAVDLSNYVTLNTTQTITNTKIFTASPNIRGGGSLTITPRSSGSNANGVHYTAQDFTTFISGIGSYANSGVFEWMYMGWGAEPWQKATNFSVSSTSLWYKNNELLHAANYSSILDGRYVNTTGDDMTGLLSAPVIRVTKVNGAGIVINKLGDNYAGIGYSGLNNVVYYSKCDANGTWVSLNELHHEFQGTNNVANFHSSTADAWVHFRNNTQSYVTSIGYFDGMSFVANDKSYNRIGVLDNGTPVFRRGSSASSPTSALWHDENWFRSNYILNQSNNELNLLSYDSNKWFPCWMNAATYNGTKTRLVIFNALGGNKPAWATHANGFSLYVDMNFIGSGWGTNSIFMNLDNYETQHGGESAFGGTEQNTLASVQIVWLRGGALYKYWNNNGAILSSSPSGYSWSSGGCSYSAVPRTIQGSIAAGFNGFRSAYINSNVASATKLQTARIIYGNSFDGTGNVAGQGLFYGTGAGYAQGGLQIRESNLGNSGAGTLVEAPSIGFHWGGRVGASIKLLTNASFYFANIDGNGATAVEVKGLKTNNICIETTSGGVYGDTSEINTIAGNLHLQHRNGGGVGIGGITPLYKLDVNGDIFARGYLYSLRSGLQVRIGSENVSYCHYITEAPTHWFNKPVEIQGTLKPYGGAHDLGSAAARWGILHAFSGSFASNVRANGWISAGEREDNAYGFINVCRSASVNNAAAFSWVRSGNAAFAIGCNTSNQIVLGAGVGGANKTLNPWFTLSAIGATLNSVSCSGRSIFAGLISSDWLRTTGAVGWYSESYGGGIYMTEPTYVQVYGNKSFLVNNTTYYAINNTGGYTSSWTGATGSDSGWASLLNYQNSIFNANNRSTPINGLTRMIGWCDTVGSQGYTSRYCISSYRTSSTWGSMMLSVGNNDAGSSGYYLQLNGNGQMYWTGGIAAATYITAKSASSDIRLKKDITPYSALPFINSQRSVMYHWNDEAKANSEVFDNNYWNFGLIAQELQQVAPHFVKDVFKDYLTIEYERLIPIMWRGIQELDVHLTKHDREILELRRENNELKNQVAGLERRLTVL